MRKISNKTQTIIYFSLFIVVYFLFEAFWFNYLSLGAGLDDAELISNTSFWNWGYGGSQPPLYTWIGYGITSLFGLHFWLLQLLRFSILASTFFAVFIGLRILKISPIIAAFASLSLFLLPQISWESQRALIHSVLGTAGSAWSFAAFIWFINKPNYQRSIVFGLTIAIAILGKYNGLIFIAALFLAGFSLQETRKTMKSRYSLTAILAGLVFMAPALVYMLQNPFGVVERASKFETNVETNWFIERMVGITDLTYASFSFVAVALGVALIISCILFFRKRYENSTNTQMNSIALCNQTKGCSELNVGENLDRACRIVGAILLAGLVICAVMVLLIGVTNVKARWLLPVLFLAAPFAALLLAKADITGRAVRAFGVISVLVAVMVPVALYGNFYWRHDKKLPIQNLDYERLYQVLQTNGSVKTILTPVPFYAGNLRLIDPNIKTLFAETPKAVERLQKPVVVLWGGRLDIAQDERVEGELFPMLEKAGFDKQKLSAVQEIDIPYRGQENGASRSEKFYYLYLK